ncbi:hypothetical protein K469DRAFT_707981 [Zopfia rhizophila CBS 207.26]|uniref:Rhodopsin domain-containing protein n=1 Tax=Zopfia rhizophila CBS 207.26 TaxID=1314779 RepID=A0A6A6E2H2_9PEZI|nr:hypothetical protein K469DRAFT_707981 [Zopfia rhizophila CBS 207.26]
MSIPPEVIAYQMAHKDEDRGRELIATSCIFGFLALSCVTARMISRKLSPAKIGVDDYLVMGAMFFGIALVVTSCLMTVYGLGRHLVTISPSELIGFGKVNLALQTAYPLTIGLARLSILALYHRIFSKTSLIFTYAIWACVVYNILWIIGIELVVYLQCRPISLLWTGHCTPARKTTVSTSILNILADIFVLILPQPMLWGLRLPIRKKLGISVIMLMGLFTVAISIARIHIILNGGSRGAVDITYTAVNTFIFTVLEPMVAIMCSCLPVMQTVVRYAISSSFGVSIIKSLTRSTGSRTRLAESDSASSNTTDNLYSKEINTSHSSKAEAITSSLHNGPASSLRENEIWVSKQAAVKYGDV